MHLPANEIHVWSTELTITDEQEKLKFYLLNTDEQKRAERFSSPLHRKRFVAARAALREILSFYLSIPPEKIQFIYTSHKKPLLHSSMQSAIQFNLSHSADLAVYALTLDNEIGIDIEKVDTNAHQGVAEKYFSKEEMDYLLQLPEAKKAQVFYQIWAAKEAIVKAIGKGLAQSLTDISVRPGEKSQTITVENKTWQVVSLPLHTDYESALASHLSNKSILFWHFFDQKVNPTNVNIPSQL